MASKKNNGKFVKLLIIALFIFFTGSIYQLVNSGSGPLSYFTKTSSINLVDGLDPYETQFLNSVFKSNKPTSTAPVKVTVTNPTTNQQNTATVTVKNVVKGDGLEAEEAAFLQKSVAVDKPGTVNTAPPPVVKVTVVGPNDVQETSLVLLTQNKDTKNSTVAELTKIIKDKVVAVNTPKSTSAKTGEPCDSFAPQSRKCSYKLGKTEGQGTSFRFCNNGRWGSWTQTCFPDQRISCEIRKSTNEYFDPGKGTYVKLPQNSGNCIPGFIYSDGCPQVVSQNNLNNLVPTYRKCEFAPGSSNLCDNIGVIPPQSQCSDYLTMTIGDAFDMGSIDSLNQTLLCDSDKFCNDKYDNGGNRFKCMFQPEVQPEYRFHCRNTVDYPF